MGKTNSWLNTPFTTDGTRLSRSCVVASTQETAPSWYARHCSPTPVFNMRLPMKAEIFLVTIRSHESLIVVTNAHFQREFPIRELRARLRQFATQYITEGDVGRTNAFRATFPYVWELSLSQTTQGKTLQHTAPSENSSEFIAPSSTSSWRKHETTGAVHTSLAASAIPPCRATTSRCGFASRNQSRTVKVLHRFSLG